MSDDVLQLGSLRLGQRVVLAALAGYSDWAYRTICRRHGLVEYCHTEMMLDRMMMLPERTKRRLAILAHGDRPLAAQIIGNDPATMAQSATILAGMDFDVIDLNFACPVNKALKRRRGGWLMSDPQQVLDVVQQVIAAVGHLKPVTLKLRQKFAQAHDNDNFWRIADGAFQAGAAGICVHARSVEVKYSGPADWDFLSQVKRRYADRLIIGSGDVGSPQRALDMLAQTGVDAAARGAIGNPWFFRQVADLLAGREPFKPSLAQQRQVLMEHMALALKIYGPSIAPKHMRKFGIKYARLHPSPKDVRMAFVAAGSPQEWHDVVGRYYGQEELRIADCGLRN